jgi:hypothetical protein
MFLEREPRKFDKINVPVLKLSTSWFAAVSVTKQRRHHQ